MKLKVLNIIACLLVSTCIISSCLDDNTTVYDTNYNASITAFSITDSIISTIPSTSSKEGKDTMTVLGSDYPFIIDQNRGLIYNADSLPVGTDVSKVVVSITADTPYIIVLANGNDSIWSETDSLNFNRPIQFRVLSEMNTFGRIYTAEINVHRQDPNKLGWSKTESNLNTNIQAQKAVYINNNVYIFAEGDTQIAVTSSDKGRTWTELETIDIPVKADYNTATAWNGKIYIVADHSLYVSENGVNWSKVETEQSFSNLLASCKNKIIGIDTENKYIESTDAITWNTYDTLPIDFPQGPYTFVNYALTTNSEMERIVLMGNNPIEEETTNMVWAQIDNEHEWFAMTYENNKNLCPKFENPTMIYYNNKLYAFGGPSTKGKEIQAFSKLYSSKDNGISWEPVTEYLFFPEEFKTLYEQAGGNYSCFVDDKNYIWIIWSQTGQIWKGRINKLGFIKQ